MLRVEVLAPFSSHVNRARSIEPETAQLVSTGFHHSRGILKLQFFFCSSILLHERSHGINRLEDETVFLNMNIVQPILGGQLRPFVSMLLPLFNPVMLSWCCRSGAHGSKFDAGELVVYFNILQFSTGSRPPYMTWGPGTKVLTNQETTTTVTDYINDCFLLLPPALDSGLASLANRQWARENRGNYRSPLYWDLVEACRMFQAEVNPNKFSASPSPSFCKEIRK